MKKIMIASMLFALAGITMVFVRIFNPGIPFLVPAACIGAQWLLIGIDYIKERALQK